MPALADFAPRLALPLIAAPMTNASSLELVRACCRNGVIGAFPINNAGTIARLDTWLETLDRDRVAGEKQPAPYAVNLIMRRVDIADWIDCLVRHEVEIAITSVGSPAAAIGPLHDIGCLVFSDVASIRHAEKAIEAGADGLVLLTAGAAGQTGFANPFAYARAVRGMFDGPIVLAGGIADGASIWAARQLGCDLAYMGTRFVATRESGVSDAYREALVRSTLDDVLLTSGLTGLPTNVLRQSVIDAGLDPDDLPADLPEQRMAEFYGRAPKPGAKRWGDTRPAGHSVAIVDDLPDVETLARRLREEYDAARSRSSTIT